nr:hypothetical protein [Tanacetum cinerariifolium]
MILHWEVPFPNSIHWPSNESVSSSEILSTRVIFSYIIPRFTSHSLTSSSINWSSSTGMVTVGVDDGTVNDILGYEIGEGTAEGAGEIGNEPDDHSGDGGV